MVVWFMVIVSMFVFQPTASAFLWFKSYKTKTPQEVVSDLQRKQIDNPNDPHINYNLGVALYKTGDYQAARENFKRALEYDKDDVNLRKRSFYNVGNIGVQVALNLLGGEWEKKSLEEKVLEQAKQEVSQALEDYKNVLILDPQDNNAQENKETAERLLKKIQDKLAKQRADKPQSQGNDQNKDDKGGSGKQGDQGQEQQQKQEGQPDAQKQSADQKNNQPDAKQDTSQQPNESKDNQKHSQGGDQQKSDQKEQQVGDGQEQGSSKEKSEPREQQGSSAQKEEALRQGDTQQEQKQKDSSDKEQQLAQAQQDMQQQAEKHKGGDGQQAMSMSASHKGTKEEDSLEKRQAQAILNTLEQDEAQLQKELIFRNIHNRQQRQTTNQKPW